MEAIKLLMTAIETLFVLVIRHFYPFEYNAILFPSESVKNAMYSSSGVILVMV